MHLNTYCCWIILNSVNFFIVDAEDVTLNRHSKTSLSHSRPISRVDINVRRLLAKELFKACTNNIRKRRENGQDFFFRSESPTLSESFENYELLNQKYYATLYDKTRKIPVYSAYKLDSSMRRTSGRVGIWKINHALLANQQPSTKTLDTGLHRGHLYPQFYAGKLEIKQLTNLVTNFAAQYGKFNQNTWKRLEEHLYKASFDECIDRYRGAKSYFLTGVIPGRNKSKSGINIPDYFWTAVCCDTSTATHQDYELKGWSFAYIVQNLPLKRLEINMYSVKDFLTSLKNDFSKFFATYSHDSKEVKECSFDSQHAIEVIRLIKLWNGEKDIFTMHGQLLEPPLQRHRHE